MEIFLLTITKNGVLEFHKSFDYRNGKSRYYYSLEENARVVKSTISLIGEIEIEQEIQNIYRIDIRYIINDIDYHVEIEALYDESTFDELMFSKFE